MKYAILGDLHSNYKNTQAVLQHIAKVAPDAEIYGLGDLYECNIGKKKANKLTDFVPLKEAAIVKKKFEQLLTFPSIIGNQELRIAKVTGEKRFLHYPEQLYIENATLIHGHQFDWNESFELVGHPPFTTPIVFSGHSHRAAIYDGLTRQKIDYNEPIKITKGPTLINVGAVTETKDWLLYDSSSMTVTFYQA